MSLKQHARALGRCTWCPKLCRFCCPTAEVEHREAVTPWFKMTVAEWVRLGRLEPTAEATEVFWHCFGCLHCRTHCVHGNDVPSALFAGRAAALAAGAAPPALLEMLARFNRSKNPWGEDLSQAAARWLDERWRVPEAQVVVFAGCQALRAGDMHLQPLFGLFEALGVDVVGMYSGEVPCCGAPLWQAGDLTGFASHAARLADSLRGARLVLCPCPTCAYVLSGLLPAQGVSLSAEVQTLDAFLAPRLVGRPVRRKLGRRVTYQDPCALNRQLERPEGVRALLAPVLEQPLDEGCWSRADAACCGGGGLVPHVLPEVAAGAARSRREQLLLGGAEAIVTACPGCSRQLGEAGEGGAPAIDFTSLLLHAYGDEPLPQFTV